MAVGIPGVLIGPEQRYTPVGVKVNDGTGTEKNERHR